MKKIIFFAIILGLISSAAESALMPSLRKSASTTKVVKDGSETTATISNSINSTKDKSGQTSNLAVLPDGKAYVGVNTYLSLRVEPFGKVSEQLYNNEEVEIINRDGDWYEVKTGKGTGWVYGKCIYDSPNSNPSSPTSEETKKNDDFDDGDYVKSPKDEGTYYYFTFETPGDYNFLFNSLKDEDDSISETDTNTSSNTSTTTSTNIKSRTNSATNTTNNSNTNVNSGNNSNNNKPKTAESKQETKNKTKLDEAVDLCYKCAWGLDAKRSQYGYPNGKRRPMYVKVMNKVYPNRNGWRRQTRMGASCDVAAAAILRYTFDKKFNRMLDSQVKYLNSSRGKKNFKKLQERNWKKWKPFTVVHTKYKSGGGHIYIYLGNGRVYNGHYRKKTYPRIEKASKIYKSPKKCKSYTVFVPR